MYQNRYKYRSKLYLVCLFCGYISTQRKQGKQKTHVSIISKGEGLFLKKT